VEVGGDVACWLGVGTDVSKGFIFASVGLVQPAKITQNMSTPMAGRNTVLFIKNAFIFLYF
jgi:hypothetical protein